MTKNIGSVDKALRLVLGLTIIGVGVYLQNWWGAIGLVLVATAAMSWCPPYAMLGISTCKEKSCQ